MASKKEQARRLKRIRRNRTKKVHLGPIRVTPQFRARVHAYAELQGLTTSELIREMLIERLEKEPFLD